MGLNVIAEELIKAWKRAGGIYKDAAEEIEAAIEKEGERKHEK